MIVHFIKNVMVAARYDELFTNFPVCCVEVDTQTGEQKLCLVCQSQMVSIGHEEIRTELRYTRAKAYRLHPYGYLVNAQ